MNGAILYRSKYGAARQYAAWLSEETGFPTLDVRRADIRQLQGLDTIVFGGGVYASGLAGLSFLKRNIGALRGKHLVVFFVGASPYEEGSFREVVRRNLGESLGDIPCFYCRGAWDPAAMSGIDRRLCRLLQRAVAKKPPEELAVWERALVEAGDARRDWTDRRYLAPILAELGAPRR